MDKFTPNTELLLKKRKSIDQLNLVDGINLMAKEQEKAAIVVKNLSLSLEVAINAVYDHLLSNPKGRLIYAGAGTSGRIGIQDGVELLPTFSWPRNRFDFIIAGGNKAILNAVEDAEDDIMSAKSATKEKKINSKDVIIGLAASGNTPFSCTVMEESKKRGALTISISNNPYGKILKFGKVKIILDTKEEVIAGSTRLKAGTAQKICLNIISSMVMIKMGKVKNGLMNEMLPTNEKLRKRKKFIDSQLMFN